MKRPISRVVELFGSFGVSYAFDFFRQGRARHWLLLLMLLLYSLGGASIATAELWVSNGPEGGAIPSIAVDPNNPNSMYVGTAGGGVWKSTDGANSWIRTSLNNVQVQAVVIDPQTSSIVYAGTNGNGVAKTTDGGSTWNYVNVGLFFPYVTAMAIDPLNAATLFAATPGGVFKSVNAASSWTQMNNGLSNFNIAALAINQSTPNIVFVGTRGGGVNKTNNGGANWFASGLPGLQVQALAIDSNATDTVLAGTNNGHVWKTVNAGGDWVPADNGIVATSISDLKVGLNGTMLANSDHSIYFSGDRGANWISLSNGLDEPDGLALALGAPDASILFSGTNGSGLYKSIDGGANWSRASAGLNASLVNAVSLGPDESVVAATAGGVYKSNDLGESWNAANGNVPTRRITDIVFDPNDPSGNTFYIGTQTGGVWKTTNRGNNYTPVNDGLTTLFIAALAIQQNDSNTLYAATLGGGAYKTINGGQLWTPVNNGLTNPLLFTLAINPADPNTIDAGTFFGGIFRTTDGGANWSTDNTGLTNLVVFACPFDDDGSNRYAGTDGGLFKRHADAPSWTRLESLVPPSIFSVAIDAQNPSNLFVGTYHDGVWRSTDGGSTWTDFSNGLTNRDVYGLYIKRLRDLGIVHFAATAGGGVNKYILAP